MEDECGFATTLKTGYEGQDKENSGHMHVESFYWLLSPSIIVGTPFLQEFGDYLSPYFPAQTQPHSRTRSKVLHQVQLIISLNRKVGVFFGCCLFCFSPSQNVSCSRQTIEDFA